MQTKVQRWGNSLALRIPRTFAVDTHIGNDSVVEMTVMDGQIIVRPVLKPDWTLDELLAGINQENIHNEVETGFASGNEIW